MYTVFAERYRNDRDTQTHVLDFATLDEAFAWMRRHANPSASSFLVPCKHTREKFADPRFIHLGWLPGDVEWLVHEIDRGGDIVFSDGSRTCGQAHVSKSVQDRLERFWRECKEPESRFAEKDTPGAAAGTPQPGCAVITPSVVELFRRRIDKMKAIYADEGCTDWYEGDDIARDVAEALDEVLASQGL